MVKLLTLRKLTIIISISSGILLLASLNKMFSTRAYNEVLERVCDMQTRDRKEDAQIFVARFRACRDLIVDALQRGVELTETFYQDVERRLMAERARRLVWAGQQCALRALPSTPVRDSWVLVSSPHKIAYCQLEKTASSTMLTFLLEINGKRTSFRTNDDLHHTAWGIFKQKGDEKVQLAHELFSYTQVRHPFTRLVSCYCGKVLEKRFAFVLMFRKFRQRRDESTHDIVRRELPRYRFSRSASQPFTAEDDGSDFLKIIPPAGKEEFMARKGDLQPPPVERMPSFREFAVNAAVEILACEKNQTCRTRVHASYGRQVDHCDPCEWNFDFIMKIETMKTDFQMLQRLVGETRPPEIDPRNVPVSPAREAVSSASEAVSSAREAGSSAREAVSSAREAGSSAREAGSSAREAVSSESKERVVNSHISACRTTAEYLHQLTSEEIDLVYTAYHEDFQLLGYQPFEFD